MPNAELIRRRRLFIRRSTFGIRHLRGERATFDQLHAVEVLALMFSNFVDGHDVRMIETRRGLGFESKALHLNGRGELARRDHLQRHGPIEADLARAINHSHSAAREFAENFVVREKTRGSEWFHSA